VTATKEAAPLAAGQDAEHVVLPIQGMDCMDCARTIERGVSRLDGVHEASISYAAARLSVTFAPGRTNVEQISRQVAELGYRVQPVGGATQEDEPGGFSGRLRKHRGNVQTAAAAVLAIAGGAVSLTSSPNWTSMALYAAATLLAGVPLARKGWATLRLTRRLDINILMTIAVIGAWAIGEALEAATVAVLFAVGEALEGFSADRARRSIRSLMSLAPAEAVVRRPDGERTIPTAQVVAGDTVIIRPGERLPVDGVILSGNSSINEAPVTGESIPVDKGQGAAVFAGSVNGAGVLDIEATRPASDSTIARIIRMVEEAQDQRAPTQRFIDSFAAYYTPAVVVIALLLAVGPPLALGSDWSTWIYRALVMLVVACPCALVISTPVSIVSAIASAARNGVLIKGGAHLEAAGSLRALALDKTGTLTIGQPRVASVVSLNGMADDDILRMAAAVERYSEHPLGEAIVRAAEERGLTSPNGSEPVSDARAHVGRGIEARMNGQAIRIGTRALIFDGEPDPAVERELLTLEQAGQTSVLLAVDGEVVAIIGLADQMRPEAARALAAIKRAGIRETVMLTGDRRIVAETIARSVGVDSVEAELLPDHKVDAIERLLARHGSVGMVGDGVNDAPALARATVGIAMGAAGSDTALETADIALMSDDLTKVADTILLSRRAKRIIAQNVVLSLGLKLVFIGLAIAGYATLWQAVVADVGASLIVTANGLRLLRRR